MLLSLPVDLSPIVLTTDSTQCLHKRTFALRVPCMASVYITAGYRPTLKNTVAL